MRTGVPLEHAARELIEDLGVASERVDDAVRKIRLLAEQVQTASEPRAVVAGGIESWYVGPTPWDRNWPELVGMLRAEGWDDDAISDLDESSTKVVAQLPNPLGEGIFDCRGLVLGYVQSGKTTNFTAVIAKAADAGYRFFLVLGGVHNALRQQTQDRLNLQLWEPHPDFWYRLTDEDDFRPDANVDVHLSASSGTRVLAIVKKNGPRLRALHRWLTAARPENLKACPMLIIDDEADQATVNTAKPDRSPTMINRIIRQLVNDVPKAAYVGYTATPFANVLIDPNDETDLYPRDFIVDLPRPASYIGPEAIFGREALRFDPDGTEEEDGHDFVREIDVDELDDLRPRGARGRQDFDPTVTANLHRALTYFLLSTAARRVRMRGNRHATALVHTSQHVDIHRRTAEVITGHMHGLATRLARRDTALLAELEEQWQEEAKRVPAEEWGNEPIAWLDIAAKLPTVAADVAVITDNSQSDERLDFDDSAPRAIIAVGGNTLSRGLTLEGLAVSFFVRTASAYDTLLQMGRWFGYRNEYADLTRIWMTAEMQEWFHHLATVEQEIRFDIERYAQGHETPADFGVRIRSHPKLAITSAAKMRSARKAEQSYSGRRIQTILFEHAEREWLEHNLDAARLLVRRARAQVVKGPAGARILGPIQSVELRDFLIGDGCYRFHENSRDLNGALIWEYIEGRLREGELSHFRIAVMSRSTPAAELGSVDLALDEPVGCINRARLSVIGGSSYADIKALMSRPDRAVDLAIAPEELPTTADELARLRNLPAEGGRGDGSGLLLLYPISKDSRPSRRAGATRSGRVRVPLEAVDHMIGVGMVFPVSRSASAKVDYYTADIRTLGVEEPDAPDEADEPAEEPEVGE